jgi:hypothetical protein
MQFEHQFPLLPLRDTDRNHLENVLSALERLHIMTSDTDEARLVMNETFRQNFRRALTGGFASPFHYVCEGVSLMEMERNAEDQDRLVYRAMKYEKG